LALALANPGYQRSFTVPRTRASFSRLADFGIDPVHLREYLFEPPILQQEGCLGSLRQQRVVNEIPVFM
jgi:hypothetical protein